MISCIFVLLWLPVTRAPWQLFFYFSILDLGRHQSNVSMANSTAAKWAQDYCNENVHPNLVSKNEKSRWGACVNHSIELRYFGWITQLLIQKTDFWAWIVIYQLSDFYYIPSCNLFPVMQNVSYHFFAMFFA